LSLRDVRGGTLRGLDTVEPPVLMIGHIVPRASLSFEPALRSDGVENRFLHLGLNDPRGVATRRPQSARRALL